MLFFTFYFIGSPSAPEELILKHTHTQLVLQWKNGYQGASPIIGYLIERKQVGKFLFHYSRKYKWK